MKLGTAIADKAINIDIAIAVFMDTSYSMPSGHTCDDQQNADSMLYVIKVVANCHYSICNLGFPTSYYTESRYFVKIVIQKKMRESGAVGPYFNWV